MAKTVTKTTDFHKVDVYFNLHTHLWSIRSRKDGLVLAHARVVVSPYLSQFVVQPAGRAKVVSTGAKNVHAFARFDSCDASPDVEGWQAFGEGLPGVCRVTYNPYKAGTFYRRAEGPEAPVHTASAVVMLAPAGAPPVVWAVPV